MTDFPYVAPPADGLTQAMADARHRRFRTAGLSSTAAASALLVAVAVLGGQSTQSLVQEPAPEQPAVTRLVPGPATQDRGTPNTGSTVTSSESSPAAAGPDGLARVPLVTGVLSVTRPGGTADTPYAAGRITRTDGRVYLPTDPGCTVTGKAEDATALCPSSSVYAPNQQGGAYELYADVCSTRTDTTTLHFTGRNEVDLTVRRGAAEVWRWSAWHPDGGDAHSVPLDTGACVQWSFNWTGVDEKGRRLPKGDYTLQATFLAGELADRDTVTYAFTIS